VRTGSAHPLPGYHLYFEDLLWIRLRQTLSYHGYPASQQLHFNMPNAIVNFVLRGFNIIFASIVLGLSIGLMKGQWEGESSPVSLQFAAFVGAISLLGGFIGLAAEWVTILQGKIGLIIDGVITVMNIAGGVVSSTLSIGGQTCFANTHL
jgi:hypothetical protein